jgi:hypothetical protein
VQASVEKRELPEAGRYEVAGRLPQVGCEAVPLAIVEKLA